MEFTKCNREQLDEFLFNSQIHDSKIVDMYYGFSDSTLKIKAFNSIDSVTYNFIFIDVQLELVIKSKGIGSQDTIISLTIEPDYSYLAKYIKGNYINEDCLYLVFQMFSGDELHIISKAVDLEVS